MGRGGGRDSPSCAFFFLRIPSCAVSNRHPCTKMPVQAGGSRNLTLGVQFFFILRTSRTTAGRRQEAGGSSGPWPTVATAAPPAPARAHTVHHSSSLTAFSSHAAVLKAAGGEMGALFSPGGNHLHGVRDRATANGTGTAAAPSYRQAGDLGGERSGEQGRARRGNPQSPQYGVRRRVGTVGSTDVAAPGPS
uniref:Uncharacterized protein n=2 Tax=Aegilops tauschii subsp. strangulata TaxID=200361 RepID=A0A453MVR5_AEGTS